MKDQLARLRSKIARPETPKIRIDRRIHVDLARLQQLEAEARHISFLPRQPASSILNGRHASRLRGRGLNFEELRAYLPSDDTRTIDWKVTARTGTPHVRVYTEERDKPVLIIVDQRMSMFFGSSLNMKSVTAAECATLSAYRISDQGDRVGGIIFGDERIDEIRPGRGRQSLTRLIAAIAAANAQLRADRPPVTPMPLNRVLTSAARIAHSNHLILIFSDFDEVDALTLRLLTGLARHNDVVLGVVFDPYAQNIPFGQQIVVSDGALQAEINTGNPDIHDRLTEMAQGRLQEILNWQKNVGVPVLPLNTAEDSILQMQKLFGLEKRGR